MKIKVFVIALSLLCVLSCKTHLDVISVNVSHYEYPVLTRKYQNEIMDMQLITNCKLPYILKEIEVSLEGTTNIWDIQKAEIFIDEGMKEKIAQAIPQNGKLIFKPFLNINRDTIDIRFSVQLKDSVNLLDKIRVTCNKIKTNIGSVKHFSIDSVTSLRLGVALRKHGQDGVNTSRIPGLVTSKKGTLLAIYDARWENDRDLQGNIDIVLNRSQDGGRTWSPMQKVLDMGQWGGLPERYNGVSDACILSDDKTGDLYLIGLWMHGVLDSKTGKWIENLSDTSTIWNHQWREKGSQPGYDVKQTSQMLITKSIDDGLTWSLPHNITKQVKKKEWWLLAPAPGRGITMTNGILVFPVEGRNEKGIQFSTIMSSKDKGVNWEVGQPAYFNTNECQVVELSDSSLMLNMRERSNRKRMEGNGRAISVTTDMGTKWTEHSTSRNALIEPACQGCLYRHNYTENGVKKHILLFSNPNSKEFRINHTIKVSFDDGRTWPEKYWLLLDEGLGAGYSCLTSINENTIGILYEGSHCDIQFQAISLSELLKK